MIRWYFLQEVESLSYTSFSTVKASQLLKGYYESLFHFTTLEKDLECTRHKISKPVMMTPSSGSVLCVCMDGVVVPLKESSKE